MLLPPDLTELREQCSILSHPELSHTCDRTTQLWNLRRSESGTLDWTTHPDVHAISRDFCGIGHEQLSGSVNACVEYAMNFIYGKHACRQSLSCTTTCDCSHADVAPTYALPGDSVHYAFDVGCCPGREEQSVNASAKSSLPSNLPIFRAGIDSCCTATCTESLNRLVNVRRCNEEFRVANGKRSTCTAIGDMPVYAKDADGKVCKITFKNVRYVPDFKYTLISVTQIWNQE